MKLAILGTRGIPNHYGGYEQITTALSEGLAIKGHEVTVYNSHNHPYQQANYGAVHLRHCFDPEYLIGSAGQFIYDLNCILDARRQNFDVLLFMGYTSSSIWGYLYPGEAVIVSNMDGVEWKRDKYSKTVKNFLKRAEKWAVTFSDFYIADSTARAEDLADTYQIKTAFIPYGVNAVEKEDAGILADLQLQTNNYLLLISRLEPENNIEAIIRGWKRSRCTLPLVIVGNTETKLGRRLLKEYSNRDGIHFAGPIFNQAKLHALRRNCCLYFHGHSVGGTNPSLLEAMSSNTLIAAHNNPYNRAVLQEDAFYFNDEESISKNLHHWIKVRPEKWKEKNLIKIERLYNWNKIINDYEAFLLHCYQTKQTCNSLPYIKKPLPTR